MNDIKATFAFAARNIKVFFKDKGLLFTALISPLVILILYILFLHGVLEDSFAAAITDMPIKLAPELINGYIAAYEISSILAVSGVTVAFIANTMMVDDKVTGVRSDFITSPVKSRVLVFGYYIATAAVTLVICYIALIAGFIYIAVMGWQLSAGDCMLIIVDVLLTTLFGTALSSIIFSFVKSRGAINAVSTIVSFAYGFICGAYYPIAQFGAGVANLVMCLPGTYFTGLLRSHFMLGYGDAFASAGMPDGAVDDVLKSLDGKMVFFGNELPVWALFLVAIISVAVLIGVFVLINVVHRKHKNKV